MACVLFTDIFINFAKMFLVKKGIRNEINILKKIKTLLILVLNSFTKF